VTKVNLHFDISTNYSIFSLPNMACFKKNSSMKRAIFNIFFYLKADFREKSTRNAFSKIFLAILLLITNFMTHTQCKKKILNHCTLSFSSCHLVTCHSEFCHSVFCHSISCLQFCLIQSATACLLDCLFDASRACCPFACHSVCCLIASLLFCPLNCHSVCGLLASLTSCQFACQSVYLLSYRLSAFLTTWLPHGQLPNP
jgi:hypothetical protein